MADTLDVLAIGDAVVDVIASTGEELLTAEGLVKGSMRVLDAAQATRLYALMGPARETSGGSAANTVAGVAALGGRAGFVGQVADDQLGEVFTHDLRAQGVEFVTPPRDGSVPTGRCLVLVTPDAQRTMNTFPGAAHTLSADAIDPRQIERAEILLLEAYLWRAEGPRSAMRRALGLARAAGRRVAFTLSDIVLVNRHRCDFHELIDRGEIDILVANEVELEALAEVDDHEAAIAAIEGRVPLLLVTRSEQGAIAVEKGRRVEVAAALVEEVVDTTGAGDLFAAGFLLGVARKFPLERALRIGSLAAAEVISHYGARPEANLRSLIEAA
ncbi:MAG: adenosine kinase [Sphingosinicella sp.]